MCEITDLLRQLIESAVGDKKGVKLCYGIIVLCSGQLPELVVESKSLIVCHSQGGIAEGPEAVHDVVCVHSFEKGLGGCIPISLQ